MMTQAQAPSNKAEKFGPFLHQQQLRHQPIELERQESELSDGRVDHERMHQADVRVPTTVIFASSSFTPDMKINRSIPNDHGFDDGDGFNDSRNNDNDGAANANVTMPNHVVQQQTRNDGTGSMNIYHNNGTGHLGPVRATMIQPQTPLTNERRSVAAMTNTPLSNQTPVMIPMQPGPNMKQHQQHAALYAAAASAQHNHIHTPPGHVASATHHHLHGQHPPLLNSPSGQPRYMQQQRQQQSQQPLRLQTSLAFVPTNPTQLPSTPQAIHQPLSAPWTLGSTDGSYAMTLALYHQQQQQNQQQEEQLGQQDDFEAQQQMESEQQQQQVERASPSEMNGIQNSAVLNANSPGGAAASAGTNSSRSSTTPPMLSNRSSVINVGGGPIQPTTAIPQQQRQLQPRTNNTHHHHHAQQPKQHPQEQHQTLPLSNILPVSMSIEDAIKALAAKRSLLQDQLFQQESSSVEAVLAASCEVMGFDIAEMWLRTGAKTHQLTNSHLRPTSLEDSVRQDLVELYYGNKSAERTHRLSPALCKRAKEANDVVWVTANTPHGAEALRCSISNVRTAVAVPVCQEASNTNITILFFSIRRIIVRPAAVEFLVHMALSAGVSSVNSLAVDGLIDRDTRKDKLEAGKSSSSVASSSFLSQDGRILRYGQTQKRVEQDLSRSEQLPNTAGALEGAGTTYRNGTNQSNYNGGDVQMRPASVGRVSVTGAPLDLVWRQLHNVEYLTDGGNSWIHTAVFNGQPVVVKTLKPECQDVVVAINEIEGELGVHSRLNHPNIVKLLGAGTTTKGIRFVVLERLDGGTLSQMFGYDTRIRDRRRRFWRKKTFSFIDVLRVGRSIADAMAYCHEHAVPGSVVLHRDLKPDNIGFTLDGTVKVLDFGLARLVENASVDSDDVYAMSGETGSLRYMAPEVADALPYNCSVDVYSFGIIMWELVACRKPFEGLNRESFYERIVHGGERPPLNKKWPQELRNLLVECWDVDSRNRPKFREISKRLDLLLKQEKGGDPSTNSNGSTKSNGSNGGSSKKNNIFPRISGMIDRHSTWF